MTLNEIREKFDDLNIPREQFDDIMQIGAFSYKASWDHVLAIAVSKISQVNSSSSSFLSMNFLSQ